VLGFVTSTQPTTETSKTSKTFQWEQFLFSKVVSKRKENKNEPKKIVSKLGGLLTKGEKYWLEEEINAFMGLK